MKKKDKIPVFQLKYKITLMLVLFSIVPIIITGASSYNIAKNKLSHKLETTSKQTTVEISRGIDNYLEGMTNLLTILAQDMNVQEADNPTYFEFAKKLIYKMKQTDDSIINIYIGTEAGLFYTEPKVELSDDFVHTEREWYKEATASGGNVVITEPYLDEATGDLVVTLASAIMKEERVMGVVAFDLSLNALSQDLSNIVLGDSGYLYIATTEGTMITHPEESFIGSDNAKSYEYWSEVSQMDSGFIEFEDNGKKMFSTYTTSDISNWKIVGIMNYEELSNDTSSINQIINIVLGITIVAAIILALVFTAPLGNNIKQVVLAMNRFASGDLSVRVHMKSNDELGILGKRFNQMTDTISELIGEIGIVSTQVLDSSIALSQVSEETSSALSEVARAVEEVAKGANDQAKSAVVGVSSMNTLGNEIDAIDNAATSMERLVHDATEITNLGLKSVDYLLDTSKKTSESTKEVSRLVFETNYSMDQINKISNTIDEITAQTNLLALNASIEAARAGESGRGFAVVADEIRSLAEQSKSSTISIKQIVKDITSKTMESVNAMEGTNQIMTDQLSTVEETKEYFYQIKGAVENLLVNASGIKKNSVDIVEINNDTLGQIEYISSISEEAASASEEVTASTEQITSTMDEIARQSGVLRDLSHELSKRMEQFQIKE